VWAPAVPPEKKFFWEEGVGILQGREGETEGGPGNRIFGPESTGLPGKGDVGVDRGGPPRKKGPRRWSRRMILGNVKVVAERKKEKGERQQEKRIIHGKESPGGVKGKKKTSAFLKLLRSTQPSKRGFPPAYLEKKKKSSKRPKFLSPRKRPDRGKRLVLGAFSLWGGGGHAKPR